MKDDLKQLKAIVSLGEGQALEFKEAPSKLDREIVAFANAVGGTIYCGVSDAGKIVGTTTSNQVRSQIQDIARNCDPPINVQISVLADQVLLIEVPEGQEKPYQCSNGFFLRIGANSQKLRTSEVKNLLHAGQMFYDSRVNSQGAVSKYFSQSAFEHFCKLAQIPPGRDYPEILQNIAAARGSKTSRRVELTNAGILLFSKRPKDLIPESCLTTVKYRGTDRYSIVDRQDFEGDLIEQIEGGINFVKRNVEVEYEISGAASRTERYRYPLVAVREALINAVVHRDYAFQNSCIYLNIFSDRLEIESPGGIFGGGDVSTLEGRSIRRNPTIADLLYRAGYGEKLGSGLLRIKEVLAENNNPPYQLSATNFFSMRFLPRIAKPQLRLLTPRQVQIVSILANSESNLASRDLAQALNASITTITRDLKELLALKLVAPVGVGRAVRYCAVVDGG